MRLRYLYVLIAAGAAAALVAWGIGSVHDDCEHSCPAQGPCPTPADCLRHHFNWTAAVVLGLVAALIVTALGLFVLRRERSGR